MSVNKRPTLRDIATHTGLHFTTVGLALRGDPRIKPSTSAIVKEAAEELGYTRDAMLSALSSYRHFQKGSFRGVIGYLHNYFDKKEVESNPREVEFLTDMRAHAEELGFKIEMFNIHEYEGCSKRFSEVLSNRGIQGLILSPLGSKTSGVFPLELSWEDFGVVAVGYSIGNIRTHRAATHQSKSMRLHLAELRALGYKRIGLIMPYSVNERTSGHFLGGYYAEQRVRSVSAHLEVMFSNTEIPTPIEIDEWIRTQKPDCIIVPNKHVLDKIRLLGWDIPHDFGVSVISRDGADDEIAGIDEQFDLLGRAAVDLMISLLQAHENGLPPFPRYSLVEGRWVWKPTLRQSAEVG